VAQRSSHPPEEQTIRVRIPTREVGKSKQCFCKIELVIVIEVSKTYFIELYYKFSAKIEINGNETRCLS
jgi:hypothetical protein